MEANPPASPAPLHSPDGGAGHGTGCSANHWKRWDAKLRGCGGLGRYVRRAAFSKPLETMGRKATELRRSECGAEGPGVPGALCPPGCERKPSETMGRKAKY